MINIAAIAAIISANMKTGIIQSMPVQEDNIADKITVGKMQPINMNAMEGAIEDIPLYSALIGVVVMLLVFTRILRFRIPLMPKNIKYPDTTNTIIRAIAGCIPFSGSNKSSIAMIC